MRTTNWILRRNLNDPNDHNVFSDAGPGKPEYWCLLLILSGDVHPNPGPKRWPCGVCRKNVLDNAVSCDACKTWFHLKCSPFGQLPPRSQAWKCHRCSTPVRPAAPAPRANAARAQPSSKTFTDLLPLLLTRFNFELPPDVVKEAESLPDDRPVPASSRPVPSSSRPEPANNRPAPTIGQTTSNKDVLRILQWNAGGLQSKKTELEHYLHEKNIDVALLQETHLTPIKTIRFKGYNIMRKDRAVGRAADRAARGGGVMTLVREGLEYEEAGAVQAANDDTTEALHTIIHLNKQQLDLVNIYVPPVRRGAEDNRQQRFDPQHWPRTRSTLICGDVNGHSPQWDQSGADEDNIGELIADWMTDAEFMAANTGEATRINPHDGSGTTPDVTLHHVTSAYLVQWKAVKELGSDHLPIIIEVRLRGQLPKEHRRTFWNTKKANWSLFKQLVEQNLEDWTCTDEQLSKTSAKFSSAIMAAAEQSIPKGNRRRHKPFWTAEVAAACRTRDKARAHGTPEEYAEAAAHARTTVAEAKQASWREYASSLNAKTDDNRTWRVIKSLDGRAGQPKPSAAISRNDKLATTPKAKANAFIKEYASVGRLHHTHDDRRFKNVVADRLHVSCRCDHRRDLSRDELNAALKELKLKKAPGEDGVSNDMLVNLPERGREALLQLANASWRTKRCPGQWTSAVIIPIPKAGKDPSNVQSYRPISLTSCIAKTIERMIKNRLADWLERNDNLSAAHAGFRKMRSTEDQLLRVVQSVSDGFNAKKAPKRTVMTLVDFSRAFDRVWRTGLYYKMLEKGVPLCITQWIHGFLCDRRARVKIDGAKSDSYGLKCGTPQGSVLSPLLFLIFIDDILEGMPQDIQASLYADDLALWSQSQNLDTATEAMQSALDRLQDWANRWKMEVNVEKTYSIIFTTDPHEARRRPDLRFNGCEVPFDATPTFLGLTLDRTLSFNAHAKKVRAKMEKRLSMLSALRGTTWGCRKKLMRNLYTAYVRSVADYGGAAWMPAAAKTTLNHIETANKRAARIITGCTKTTPSEMLLEEASLLPTEHRRDQLCCIAYEKALRLPDDNPRSTAANHPQRKRLRSQPSFRELAKAHSVQLKLDQFPREPLEAIPPSAPWSPPPNITLHDELRRPIKRTDDPAVKKQAAEETLAALPPSDVTIWTDGSAEKDLKNGGAGFVAEYKDRRNRTALHKKSTQAGSVCSSFKAELVAFEAALEWLSNSLRSITLSENEVLICTDSQSLVKSLLSGQQRRTDATSKHVWELISQLFPAEECHLTVQWIPGHCELYGNEAADQAAREGATAHGQNDIAIDFDTAKAVIKRKVEEYWKRSITHPFMEHKRRAERIDQTELAVTEERIVSQLRCGGHCPILQKYLHFIQVAEEDTCQMCRREPETAEHCLLRCPATEVERSQILGRDVNLTALWERPKDVIKFLRRTGRLDARQH